VPTIEIGTARLAINVARAAQEHENHEHDEHDGEAELELDVAHGGADADGAVRQDLHFERGR
jgi:hypothetical protein